MIALSRAAQPIAGEPPVEHLEPKLAADAMIAALRQTLNLG
jgi:hypothetical protein